MRVRLSIGAMFASLGLALASPVWADICQTPFMHDGGRVVVEGEGALQLGANLSFTDVSRPSGGTCHARVRGTAQYGLAGLPGGEADIDYWMTVQDGQAAFVRYEDRNQAASGRPGQFDLRMLGLFSYSEPVTRAGQVFPPLSFRIELDKKAVQTAPIVIHTGEKTVGEQARIQTAAGEQSCWPVQYERRIEPTQASFSGIVLPVPGMNSAITDWYCPDVNMVLKQESRQGGLVSVLEVTQLE